MNWLFKLINPSQIKNNVWSQPDGKKNGSSNHAPLIHSEYIKILNLWLYHVLILTYLNFILRLLKL